MTKAMIELFPKYKDTVPGINGWALEDVKDPAGAVVKVTAKRGQGGQLSVTFKLSAPLAYGQTVIMPAPVPTDYTTCAARTRFLL